MPPVAGETRGALYLKKPIPSMGRKVINHSSEPKKKITEVTFSDYYFKKGSLHDNYKKGNVLLL